MKVLTVATVLTATVAIPAVPAAAAGTGWWAMPGYLVTNSGFNPNETSVTVPTVPNLRLIYASSPDRIGQRAPLVADELVYTMDDLGVTATEEATGAQRWRFEPVDEGYVLTQIVHAAGQLVVAAQYWAGMPGDDHARIFVLDAATGTVVRHFNDHGLITQMLVDRGVVVASGESRWTTDTRAYSIADGQLIWTHDRHMRLPVSAGGRVVLSGTGWAVLPLLSVIIDIETGKIIHSEANREYRPLAADEKGTKFYVAWGHSLQVLDASTGTLTWLASNLSPAFAVVSPTRLYVTSFGGTVFALNRGTGAIFWSRTIPGSEYQRAIVAGGVMYVTAKGDRVHTLNPVNGAPLNAPAFTGAVDQIVATYGRVYSTDGTKVTVYGL